jgi:hypothetical protein
MTMATPLSASKMPWRARLTRLFIWVSVLAWGILLGAKLFDLRVLVGAWSASPPASLKLLPYGSQYPVDTGEFFIPSSAALLLASCGALVSGWRTPLKYRGWLAVSAVMIFATLIFTVMYFWPRNAALWAVAKGTATALQDPAEIRKMVHDWVACDWLRVAMASVGFVAAVRAISVPFPVLREAAAPTPLGVKIVYGLGAAGVVLFVLYFLGVIG